MALSEITLYTNGCVGADIHLLNSFLTQSETAYMRASRPMGHVDEKITMGFNRCAHSYVRSVLQGLEMSRSIFNAHDESARDIEGKVKGMIAGIADYIVSSDTVRKHNNARNCFAEYVVWVLTASSMSPDFQAVPASPNMDASVGKQSKGGDVLMYNTYGDPSLAFLIDVYASSKIGGNPSMDRELERKRVRLPINRAYGLPCIVFSVDELSRMIGTNDCVGDAREIVRANGNLDVWGKRQRSVVRSYIADRLIEVHKKLERHVQRDLTDAVCAQYISENVDRIRELL